MGVLGVERAFTVFGAQDSGCPSWGVEHAGQRWFVKTAVRPEARAGLARVAALHAVVRHTAIVPLAHVLDGTDGPTLVYPWCEGQVLNRATTSGSDRAALADFQRLPVGQVRAALDQVLDAHLAVAAAGWVTCDLYDGCFLYDADAGRMHLVDLDEYRPGPFVLNSGRLPGSERYMAPEEFRPGARIDQRTSVFALGRAAFHLLDGPGGWRGTAAQHGVVERATRPEQVARYAGVAEFVAAWRAASG
ncbi:protein kinase family protein [Kineococcus sp. SYSU DK003]|uniref:serine/threonine protein kinase n=1 Tax=Kineococcus sp. SYSU DK003 TaxID=3383124 RepID=UPI003D7F11FB